MRSRHRELKQRNDPAACVRRRHFREINRHSRGRETDRDSEHNAADNQNRGRWRDGAGECANAEDGCREEQNVSATKTIRHSSADDGADRRAEKNSTDHNFLGDGY